MCDRQVVDTLVINLDFTRWDILLCVHSVSLASLLQTRILIVTYGVRGGKVVGAVPSSSKIYISVSMDRDRGSTAR
jgi:uncharacterized membrane protein (DUF4010 family)